ncbi:hypothetical protein PM082_011424 [Marasmius tenuissimus]|nr:hypothetical protein PM082_011424 [Marasmius tenuissimus]
MHGPVLGEAIQGLTRDGWDSVALSSQTAIVTLQIYGLTLPPSRITLLNNVEYSNYCQIGAQGTSIGDASADIPHPSKPSKLHLFGRVEPAAGVPVCGTISRGPGRPGTSIYYNYSTETGKSNPKHLVCERIGRGVTLDIQSGIRQINLRRLSWSGVAETDRGIGATDSEVLNRM